MGLGLGVPHHNNIAKLRWKAWVRREEGSRVVPKWAWWSFNAIAEIAQERHNNPPPIAMNADRLSSGCIPRSHSSCARASWCTQIDTQVEWQENWYGEERGLGEERLVGVAPNSILNLWSQISSMSMSGELQSRESRMKWQGNWPSGGGFWGYNVVWGYRARVWPGVAPNSNCNICSHIVPMSGEILRESRMEWQGNWSAGGGCRRKSDSRI